ncbi:MAG: Ig-like domain-containing protein [Aminipila sp.]
MKKRIGAIVALTLLMVMMTTTLCFAGTLELEDSYPRNGDKGMQVENSGVKLYFNQNMINKNNEAANLKCVKLTDPKGKKLPIRVLYSPKEKGLVLVLVDKQTLLSDSTYRLSVSGDIESASGDTLGEDVHIKFNTVDTSASMKANMVMMGLMMVAVIWASSKAAKKKDEKEKEEATVDDKVNPYKVAKETGKSVEAIVAKDQKDKEKHRKKMEKKLAKEAQDEVLDDNVISNDNKRVKGARPISAGGSTYITGRKAAAEEAARRKAQAGTTRPKNKAKKKN